MPANRYDAIVIGLGPAGATSAYELAKNNLKVLAVDKEMFPRYKVCGGAVSAKVDRILKFKFSQVVEDVVESATFAYRSRRHLSISHHKPIASLVMRDSFDNLLVDMAKGAGAVILDGTRVKKIKEDEDWVVVETDKGRFQARVFIAGDGASSFTAREIFGMDLDEYALTIECEVGAPEEVLNGLRGRIIIDYGYIPYGYAWVFPKKNLFSIGIAGINSRLSQSIKVYFNDFVNSQNILRGLNMEKQRGWIIPQFCGGKKKIASRRILLIGDAAGLVDPFIGEGIYYAIRSGQIAADAVKDGINSGDFRIYEEMIKDEVYPELAAAKHLSDMVYSHPRMWYNMLESDPLLMKRYYDVITGDGNYRIFLQDVMDTTRFDVMIKVIKGWLKGTLSNWKLKIANCKF